MAKALAVLFLMAAFAQAEVVDIVVTDAKCSSTGCVALVSRAIGCVISQRDDGEALVLTCGHIARQPGEAVVEYRGNRSRALLVNATVTPTTDLALYRTRLSSVVTETQCLAQDDPPAGTDVTVLKPRQEPIKRRITHVSSTMRLSGPAQQGDSGSPVVTSTGALAGVVFATDGQETFATPSSRIRTWLSESCGVKPQMICIIPALPIPVPVPVPVLPPIARYQPQTVPPPKASAQSPQSPRPEASPAPAPPKASPPDPAPPHTAPQIETPRPSPPDDAPPPQKKPRLASDVSALLWALGASGLGGGTVSAVILAIQALLRARRAVKQVVKPLVVTADSPPPPQAIITETQFAPYEKDTFAEAFAWAESQFARKYPGSVSMIETLKSLMNQYLAAKGIKQTRKEST